MVGGIEMARRRVTDPDLLQQLNTPAIGMGAPALPATRQRVTDPAILQRLDRVTRIKDAAAELRGKIQSPAGRIEQAFSEADLPEANQPFPLPAGSEYGFTENMMSRLPFGDETAALGGGIGRYLAGKSGLAPEKSFTDAWNYGQAINRAGQEQYRGEHPLGDFAGQALGVVAGGAPSGAAATLGVRGAPAAVQIPATLPGRIAEGVKSGAPIGALYGAGEGDTLKERATNMAISAGTGTALGAALPVAGTIGRSARRLSTEYEPQLGGHAPRLEQAADHFYQQMDAAGVQLRPNTFNRILTNIQVRAHNAGIDDQLHPAATAIVRALRNDIRDTTRVPTMRRMDQIRRKIRDAVPRNASDDERRIIRTMVEGMDENLNRLTPRDLTGGNPRASVTALREGRRLQKQMYKAETVDNLVENAKDKLGKNYTQAGLQTAIKQEFGSLSKKIRMDPREAGRWTNEERMLIKKIVRGGSGEKIGRVLGRLALRGPIGATAYTSGGGAAMLAGLDPVTTGILATGGLAVGEGAKRISTARNVMNTERLGNLIEHGHTRLPKPAVRPRGVQARRLAIPLAIGLGDRLLTGDQ
jgi:hypothetical protein